MVCVSKLCTGTEITCMKISQALQGVEALGVFHQLLDSEFPVISTEKLPWIFGWRHLDDLLCAVDTPIVVYDIVDIIKHSRKR